MSNLPWVPRINATKVISVTPTISTSAYTSGDQIGGIMTLTDCVRQDSNGGFGISELVGVTVLDNDKQDANIDIWLFNVSPTVTSVDNGAFAMSAANLVLQCIGVVAVGVTYSNAAAVSVSSTVNLNKVLRVANTAPLPTTIFAIGIVRGTPTYTTTTSLQFQFEFFLD